MLGPMVAAYGGYVPMITGRGLGHTGILLDKLGKRSGLRYLPDDNVSAEIIQTWVWRLLGKPARLHRRTNVLRHPRYYATVDFLFRLITGSILAKKLAEGLDALVMDVKSAAVRLCRPSELSEALAEAIVGVAEAARSSHYGVVNRYERCWLAPVTRWKCVAVRF